MKTINVTFEDKDYKRLKNKKEDLPWREFILKLTDINNKEDKKIE